MAHPWDGLHARTVSAVRTAGMLLRARFRGEYAVREKAPHDPVTTADMEANQSLRASLLELLPDSGWLSEETADSAHRLSAARVWVVDPMDGTKSFLQGLPEFTVSVALVEQGVPVLGVVYNPLTEEMFTAVRRAGAFLNGRRLAVTSRQRLPGATLLASRSEYRGRRFQVFRQTCRIQPLGSIAYKMARVAAGMADGVVSLKPKSEWDLCAGTLLVEEAGGRVTDLEGVPLGFNRPDPGRMGVAATNGRIHGELLALSRGPARG